MLVKPSPRTVFGTLLLVQLLFGINYTVTKYLLSYFSPLVWASARCIITAVLLLLVVEATGRPRPKGRGFYLPMLLLSLFGIVVNQAMFMVGLRYTTPTNSAILNTLIPMFTLIFVILRGEEKMTKEKGLGFLLAFAGVLVLLGVEKLKFSSETLFGDLLTVGNSVSYGIFLAVGKKFLERHDRIWSTTWMFLFGSVGLTAIGIPEWGTYNGLPNRLDVWLCAAYAILFGTVATYLLVNWALAHTEASKVALFIYVQPVVAALTSWLWLGQTLTLRTLAGALFIFAGVFAATLLHRERPSLQLVEEPRRNVG